MIEPSLRVIDEMTQRIRQFDKEIEQLCDERYPETKRLREIRGIGPITVLCFVLVIEDRHRIERTRDVGAYIGLVPKRDQSGRSDKELSISKCGNGSKVVRSDAERVEKTIYLRARATRSLNPNLR